MVQYSQLRVEHTNDLAKKLEDLGVVVGTRALALLVHRDRADRRETRIVSMLQFVTSTVWRSLFGKQADVLEADAENDDTYLIREKEPITNRFISVPADLGRLNLAQFVGGIIKGVLDGAGFPSAVSALHQDGGHAIGCHTVFVVKFEPSVIAREKTLSS